MTETSPPATSAVAPRRATGVELLGPMRNSGYRIAPHLVRRGDGQTVQITPLLAAVLAAVDGRRDLAQVAEAVAADTGRHLHPDDVGMLVDGHLRRLGLVLDADGSEPAVRRTEPLLGLRARVGVTSPAMTRRIARPFLWLFRPTVVIAVMTAFVLLAQWTIFEHGLGGPIESALAQPALLLGLIGLIVASAAFHEVGHATACRYGGAEPGVMGAAIYLLWPAFYTDVTDSYRLGRAGRLRVDLGGLYFNAVFTVVSAVAWRLTGIDALLLLVPVQVFQMARQLVPLVRFDGYHILADLIGVPDLFSRLRPTLQRAIPWRRDRTPNPLRPWAQAVVVAWVAVVVPFLLVSFTLLITSLPTVLRAAVASLRLQVALLTDNVDAGHHAAVALGVVAIVTVAFVPLATIYLGGRIAHRGTTRFWTATEGHPLHRGAAFAVLALVLALHGPGMLPRTPRQTTIAQAAAPGPGTTELAMGEPVAVTPTRPRPRPAPAATPQPTTTTTVPAPPTTAPPPPTPPAAASPAPAPAAAPATPAWPFPFDPPDPAEPGDNQVVVTNAVDGAAAYSLRAGVAWVSGPTMHNANRAYALATCTSCRTVAVAFQVVAATVPNAVAVPENLAVAVNTECESCLTRALAVQLAVTLDQVPPRRVRAQVESIVTRLQAQQQRYRRAEPGEILGRLRADRAAVLALLDPYLVEPDPVEANGGRPDRAGADELVAAPIGDDSALLSEVVDEETSATSSDGPDGVAPAPTPDAGPVALDERPTGNAPAVDAAEVIGSGGVVAGTGGAAAGAGASDADGNGTTSGTATDETPEAAGDVAPEPDPDAEEPAPAVRPEDRPDLTTDPDPSPDGDAPPEPVVAVDPTANGVQPTTSEPSA